MKILIYYDCSIKFVCKNNFINYGNIECLNNGKISIKCKLYKNESNKINPKPFIITTMDNKNNNYLTDETFTKIHSKYWKSNYIL